MSKKQNGHKPTEATLRIALPTGETQKRKVTGAEVHIGSGSHSEVRISDPDVSATHAMIVFDGDDYSIADEHGRGGTFVNGDPITKPRKLAHGDVICVGKSQITFKRKHGAKGASSGVETKAPSGNGGYELEKREKHAKHKKHVKDKHNGKANDHALIAAVATSPSPNGAAEAERKKNKAKVKDKENERIKAARVRAWGGIIATVLSVVLTVTISLLVTRMGGTQSNGAGALGGASSSKKLAGLSDSRKIKGGTFEASGAVAVSDANGILFVDDSKPDHVFYMPVNALGEQEGPVIPIPLGVSVENPEGITRFGKRYMVTGSLSTDASNESGGIAVFDFDAPTQTVSNVVALTGVRKFLLDNVPELKAWAHKSSVDGGLNVEGIAVDPDPAHPRVVLGLRGPVLNGNALVVPIRIVDRHAPLTIQNLAMDEPNAIQLNLGGQAIRDIQYDSQLRTFLIISGAPETEDKTDFTLWAWNGEANQADEQSRPKQQALLNKKMKPEGIAPLRVSNQSFVFIVGDSSSYAKIDYIAP